SAAMRDAGLDPTVVCRTNFASTYWTIPQQLAHATANGASLRPGDLFASGTLSGPEPGSWGSMMELTSAGSQPLRLPSGETRSFLEDGDTVVLRGACQRRGLARVGFGELLGTIMAADAHHAEGTHATALSKGPPGGERL